MPGKREESSRGWRAGVCVCLCAVLRVCELAAGGGASVGGRVGVGSRRVYKGGGMNLEIPEGLGDLLRDFTVAVLKERPPDLYDFAVDCNIFSS